MRGLKIAVATVAMTALAVSGAAAQTYHVEANDQSFSPARILVGIGDTVHWTSLSEGSGHNVEQTAGIFRSGDVGDVAEYQRKFSAGTFKYICENHEFQGMKGKVKIKPQVDASGAKPVVIWATNSTNTGSKFDVQYRIENGNWKNWKSNTSSNRATFGKDHEPVHIQSGTSYFFRARSQKSGNQSGWSPKRVYNH